jgi:hypothetical protein
MQVALGNKTVAGVIASSGGYPDSQPRAKVSFAVFGTAGSEDFNYIEMRLLDRKLTTPHRLAVFEGGHTLPPDAVALDAIEWMELQAMKSGRRTRDDGIGTLHQLEALVADFTGLRDVSAETGKAKELSSQREIKQALARERAADDDENRAINEIVDLESRLADDAQRTAALTALRERLERQSKKARSDEASSERSQARRILRAVTAGAAGRVKDAGYRELLDQFAYRER